MKVLIAASPLTGHVNPLLAVGRLLARRGDTVLVVTDPSFRQKVESSGLRLTAYEDRGAATYLEPHLPPGPVRWTHEFEHRFIEPMATQAAVLRETIRTEAPDVIVAGSLFLGILPLLLDATTCRPPIIVLNISFLFLDRPDDAPVGMGLLPARDDIERARYAALKVGLDASFVRPVRALTDARLARLGARPLPASLTQSLAILPDAFLQPSVREFEYDFGTFPPGLRFVGLLPTTPMAVAVPEWWPDLESGKSIILVTQGTLANADFSELLEPTLQALEGRDDLLIVATTGGRSVEEIHCEIPANGRVATFLPFDVLLPKIDLLVTNGGYGSVSQALAAGVPIVSAGLTEDKAEVGARIEWSGVGLNLATNRPTEDALRWAVERVLTEQRFRERARVMARAFADLDPGREILAAIDALTHVSG